MASSLRSVAHPFRPVQHQTNYRGISTETQSKPEGSIGDAFASLSNNHVELPPRFGDLKRELIGANGEAILDSWFRLLRHLDNETLPRVASMGPGAVPEITFSSIMENGGRLPEEAADLVKRHGTIIIRGLVPEKQALDWKQSLLEYAKENPSTKGFPSDNIQVYELYWSKAQLEARSHQNMLIAQTALNTLWSKQDDDRVVLSEPTTYCDRLRIRTPGDTSFNLGPHIDGGSLERWEDPEYRKCYTKILEGRWEDHDAFLIGPRLKATMDMYNCIGGCSALRTYQGWLSLSDCGPGNGTLRVIPDLKTSTAYTLLRPFVTQTTGSWSLDSSSSLFQGATMGAGQELLPNLHTHLNPAGAVSIPTVRPGDAVFWHCDVVHMVEGEHRGDKDSSVLYIPAAPLCDLNANYLKRERASFLNGIPPPDFPGGVGESQHIGRGTADSLSEAGKRAMGLVPFDAGSAHTPGEQAAYKYANEVLGFS
ncbi:hypothetical protein M426DRAFT_60889 [Hypoxylon sp. CI-4A]|nr:hypothetical protein M426DRAFT_60889 [Hypoxylon sp. CI-4A]